MEYYMLFVLVAALFKSLILYYIGDLLMKNQHLRVFLGLKNDDFQDSNEIDSANIISVILRKIGWLCKGLAIALFVLNLIGGAAFGGKM